MTKRQKRQKDKKKTRQKDKKTKHLKTKDKDQKRVYYCDVRAVSHSCIVFDDFLELQ